MVARTNWEMDIPHNPRYTVVDRKELTVVPPHQYLSRFKLRNIPEPMKKLQITLSSNAPSDR